MLRRLTVSCDQFFEFLSVRILARDVRVSIKSLGTAVYGMNGTLASTRWSYVSSPVLSVLRANQDSYVRPAQSLIRPLVPTYENGPCILTSSSSPFSLVYSRHVYPRVHGLLG